jgi:TRAP-type C4-dicarboxylate transport system substrate-binding protein
MKREKVVFFWTVIFIALFTVSLFSASKPAPTQAFEPIKLNFAEQDPAVGWGPVHAWQPMIKMMEKATNNRIKIDYYPGQTLCKGVDAWSSTKSGIVDIAWCFHGYWAAMTPLADVIALPFMPIPSAEAASATLWKLYEKYPNIKKSFADNYIQLLWTSEPYRIITTKKQVKTLEDLKGMKMRTIGGPPVNMWKKLGAVPMRVPMPDYYLALEKGVLDGGGAPWEAIEDNRLMEAVKYYTYVPLYTAYFSIAWNWKKWNSLPKDIQDAIMDCCGGLKGSKYGGRQMFDTAAKEGPELVRKEGYPIIEYTLPPEEVARWEAIAGKPLWEEWVKNMEAAGYSEARDVLNDTLNMLKAYK